MKVNVEELSSVQRRVEVTIPAKEVDKTLSGIYKTIGRQVKIKGFRPGKVPRAIMERHYGPQASAEAAEDLIGSSYPMALSEAKVDPVARPDFDFSAPEAGADFTYRVTLDVKPEFELEAEKYKGLKLKEPDFKVTDEDVEKYLESLRERHAVTVPVEEERPAAIGDVAVISYSSFMDGEPVEGGTADNVEVELGSGKAQAEIETALVKAKPGDIVETTVSYDDNAPNPDFKGKDVVFKLVVKELKSKVLPELDDDFAKSVSPEFENLQAVKDRITADMESTFQEQKDMAVKGQIMDALREMAEFELPESLVDAEAEGMVENIIQRFRQQGMDPDQAGLDMDKMRDDFRPQAEKKVKAGIVLSKISDLEEVKIEEADRDEHFDKLSSQVGQPAKILKEMYIKNNMMADLAAQLLEEKTLRAIKADAIIELVDPAELTENDKQNGESAE